ncbi:hypothetical protein [Edaphobacter bradus]|uniref:hypothetical protein n=1 Tax=Edaphobacter bradus TaxID=2259016 RepID=UPI0021E0C23C|nr:hypothetical protein [Edaphobacter bradus]
MKRVILCTFIALSLAGLAVAEEKSKTALPSTARGQTATSQTHNDQRTGDDVFKANCSRCHMPPMALSPRLTGTVIMHMRSRARLSRRDEELLLKYMAP